MKTEKKYNWELEIQCPTCSQEIVLNGVMFQVDMVSLYKQELINQIHDKCMAMNSKEEIISYLEELKKE